MKQLIMLAAMVMVSTANVVGRAGWGKLKHFLYSITHSFLYSINYL